MSRETEHGVAAANATENVRGEGPKVVNRRHGKHPDAVYVGRPGPFGNPFKIGRDGTLSVVIHAYEVWIAQPAQKELRQRMQRELAGRDLECWCAPAPCHADVILRVANADPEAGE